MSPSSTSHFLSRTEQDQILDATSLQQIVLHSVPPLEPNRYKGQAGKVGVIGGCREYTGAPFFASYSALKLGADLSHVFCTNGAATVIKCYSPELIVHPYIPDEEELSYGTSRLSEEQKKELVDRAVDAICAWLYKFDVLVVGPGLGRDSLVLSTVERVLRAAREREIPLVIDADALHLITQSPEIIQGYSKAILTPNAPELQRLLAKLGIEKDDRRERLVRNLASRLNGPIVVSKGARDVISDGRLVALCDTKGSPRRAGGQGDVMAGAIATFMAWASKGNVIEKENQTESNRTMPPAFITAAYGGCMVTRLASSEAFRERGRAMGASDVMMALGRVVDGLVNAKDDER